MDLRKHEKGRNSPRDNKVFNDALIVNLYLFPFNEFSLN